MKKTEDKYLHFDGMPSDVPNDMPWGQTQWNNLSGTEWQEQGYSGTDWQDANLNASGNSEDDEYNPNPPITPTSGRSVWRVLPPIAPKSDRSSYQNYSSNMSLVLPDNDNSIMPDSDQWSNHPGFLGGTWWKDFWFPGKAEKERAAAARESIDGKYPISGSCDVLTSTEAAIQASITNHGKATKRGPKRVAKRNIPILNNKLKTVSANRQVQCDSEAQDQAQNDRMDMFMQSQMQEKEKPEGVSAVNVILGLVIIGGLVWGVSRLAKPQAPVVMPAR